MDAVKGLIPGMGGDEESPEEKEKARQCKRVRNLENTRQQTIYSRKSMSIDMLLMAACSSSSSSTERPGVGEKSKATNPR